MSFSMSATLSLRRYISTENNSLLIAHWTTEYRKWLSNSEFVFDSADKWRICYLSGL